MQRVAYGTMCMNCVAYGDILKQTVHLEQLEAAKNNHLEQIATNDDPQDNVESTESSSNTYDANWDATVYANAYASSDSSSEESSDDSSDDSNNDSDEDSNDDSDAFSDDYSDDDEFHNSSDYSSSHSSDHSSDESTISLEGEIALNVDQDAFCMINHNSDEMSEADNNTEDGNDDTFYSIIKYVLRGKVHIF
jgi:hypothetical protein